ncbi:AAA family ATPase [Mobilicoccus sp.]|uniref:AAA family ATPase n=1 Tax=Mobilicoccus sp. TaxID=2034349 RepID=UPI0028B16E13|nr:AAA family ATPase [Mobilicoccus sp.]
MATHPIARLTASSFGPLDRVDIEVSPALNIVTGDNGTGKTQLLKLLYACTRTISESGNPTMTKAALQVALAAKLSGVFRPDQLGRLARRAPGRNRAEVKVKYRGIGDPLEFSFATNSRHEVKVASFPTTPLDDVPVYFPARELLSIYPGLAALYDSREIELEETWRDTAVLLSRQALRGQRGDQANALLAPLLEVMEGRVTEEGGRFYVTLPNTRGGGDRFEAHLVSEGYRKLAMVIRLVSSGVLLQSGYLFWDEPEANLNPTTQRAVAQAILTLAARGTQVFVATHSVFLLRELEMLIGAGESTLRPEDVRYIGLYRDVSDDGVRVTAESTTDPAELSSIAALRAESEQSLRYLTA